MIVEVVSNVEASIVGVMTGTEIPPPSFRLVELPRDEESEASEVKLGDSLVVTVDVTVPSVPEITLVPFCDVGNVEVVDEISALVTGPELVPDVTIITVEFVAIVEEDEAALPGDVVIVEFVVPQGALLDAPEVRVVTTPEIVVSGTTVGETWPVEFAVETKLVVEVLERLLVGTGAGDPMFDELSPFVLTVEMTVVVITVPAVFEIEEVAFEGTGNGVVSDIELLVAVSSPVVTVPPVPEIVEVSLPEKILVDADTTEVEMTVAVTLPIETV